MKLIKISLFLIYAAFVTLNSMQVELEQLSNKTPKQKCSVIKSKHEDDCTLIALIISKDEILPNYIKLILNKEHSIFVYKPMLKYIIKILLKELVPLTGVLELKGI